MKFVVFGDGFIGLRQAAHRLARQATETGMFGSGVEIWNVDRLVKIFGNSNPEVLSFINSNKKGLGYWVWQPLILLYSMQNAEENEVILMLDAGCQINMTTEAIARFQEYLVFVEDKDALFMQIKEGSFGIEAYEEIYWNKRKVIERINVREESLQTPQIQSGIILIKNSPDALRLVQDWLNLCIENNFEFITDTDDPSDEVSGFISHRYSQAVLSLLVKRGGYCILQDETYWAPDWEVGTNFPIWAMRNRSGGDAFRRNIFDLSLIVLARLERITLRFLRH